MKRQVVVVGLECLFERAFDAFGDARMPLLSHLFGHARVVALAQAVVYQAARQAVFVNDLQDLFALELEQQLSELVFTEVAEPEGEVERQRPAEDRE